MGLEDKLCGAVNGPEVLRSRLDTIQSGIAEAMNYRLAIDFLQPRLFGTRTSFLASGYVEQISELGLYRRRANRLPRVLTDPFPAAEHDRQPFAAGRRFQQ